MSDLRNRWDQLWRTELPAYSKATNGPVKWDHCCARIILDNVFGGHWKDHILAPANKHMTDDQLTRAIRLAEQVLSGEADLHALNRNSLQWRGHQQRSAA
jgi:hypothetical protein